MLMFGAGESDAPAGLRAALADGNRLQDIHLAEMQVGRRGNEVLETALEKAKAEGLRPQIYTHPLGYHGHAAGPIVGLWDRQDGVPGTGEYALFDDTVYSVELNVVKSVPEWDGQDVRIMLEEDAALTGGAMHWLDGRQEALQHHRLSQRSFAFTAIFQLNQISFTTHFYHEWDGEYRPEQ